MTRLAGLLFSEETLQSALDLTSRLSRDVLPQAAGAGVTLISGENKHTAAYTDDSVGRADALQYKFDEGPCLSAWRDNSIIRSDDVDGESRWPRWSPAAAEIGLRSSLSAQIGR